MAIDAALEQIEAQLQEMGQRVLSAVRGAIRALEERDRELADEVIAFDDQVDSHFLGIEHSIQGLLALQTPVARDLRLLLAMIHINLLLERSADGCVTIAKLSKLVSDIEPDPALVAVLSEMGERAEEMVRVALDSFSQRELEGAVEPRRARRVDRPRESALRRAARGRDGRPGDARMGPADGRRRTDDRADRRPRGGHRRADRVSADGRVPRVHRRLTPRQLELPDVAAKDAFVRHRKLLVVLALVLGIVLMAIAVVYWAEPAHSLPSFFPGHEAGSDHHHVKHGIAAFLLGLACFAFAWFNSGPKKSAAQAPDAD